jgi:hypothetical protein
MHGLARLHSRGPALLPKEIWVCGFLAATLQTMNFS